MIWFLFVTKLPKYLNKIDNIINPSITFTFIYLQPNIKRWSKNPNPNLRMIQTNHQQTQAQNNGQPMHVHTVEYQMWTV